MVRIHRCHHSNLDLNDFHTHPRPHHLNLDSNDFTTLTPSILSNNQNFAISEKRGKRRTGKKKEWGREREGGREGGKQAEA
eukprot:1380928-Pyramimonas_sp.AAC.1